MRLVLNKRDLDNNAGSGGLEIVIEGCRGIWRRTYRVRLYFWSCIKGRYSAMFGMVLRGIIIR